jgi:hypothetical protein
MQKLAGDLVHVRDLQKQALRRREGRRQRAALQGTVDGTGGAGFGLHLDDPGNRAPDVLIAFGRPTVGMLAHI